MTISRRKFIHLLTLSSTACLTLLTPLRSWAVWASNAFKADELEVAIHNLFGTNDLIESKNITLKIPKTAENGASVPITIKTSLPHIESISIFVKDNPFPLTATFIIPEGTLANVSTRIRLAKSTTVIAVIKTDDKLYSTSQEVNVTIGGCGN